MNFTQSSIFNYIYDRLQSTYNWTNENLRNSLYSNLMEALSYGLRKVISQCQFLLSEAIFRTASKRNAVHAHAWSLNYIPHRKKGAISNIIVSSDENFREFNPSANTVYSENTIRIPRWTAIASTDGIINAYTTKEVTYFKGTTTRHLRLPCEGTTPPTTPAPFMINSFGLAAIPVSLVIAPDPLLGVNPNNVLAGNHNIVPGSLIKISGTAFFDGDFVTQQYPAGFDNALRPYYVIIQTDYLNSLSDVRLSTPFAVGATLSVGQVSIPIKEGTPASTTLIARGVINERFPIFNPNIDNDEIQVFLLNNADVIIDEVKVLKERRDFFFIRDLNQYYCKVINDDRFQYIYLEFGDDISTRKLPVNQKILIKYAETLGASGESEAVFNLTQFSAPLISDQGNTVTGLFPINFEPLTQGADYESIESIKLNSRKQFADNYLAISDEGWEAIVNDHPSVHNSVQWTSFDLNKFEINSAQNIVYLAAINKIGKGILPSSQIAQEISFFYIRPLAGLTDYVSWRQSYLINLRPTLDIRLRSTSVEDFKTKVTNDLITTYNVLNVPYRGSVFDSNITELVQRYKDEVVFVKPSLEYCELSVNNPDMALNTPFFFKGTYRAATPSERDCYIDVDTGTNSLKLWLRRKIGGVWSQWYLIGRQNAVNLVSITVPSDPSYTGFTFNTPSIPIGGSSNDDFYNSILLTISQLASPYNAPNPLSLDPFLSTDFTNPSHRKINPTESDPDGYELKYTYKTRDSDNRFTNDVRLPYINNIMDITEDDIIFDIKSV